MKLAWVVGHQILPALTGGHLRSASLVRALAASGAAVRVYALTGRREDLRLFAGVTADSPAPGVEQWVDRRLLHGSVQALGRRLSVPHLWQGTLPGRLTSLARLRAIVDDCDAVVCDFPFAAPMVRRVTPAAKPLFMNSHGLEYELVRQPYWRERVKAREAAAAALVDGLIACDRDDITFYRQQRSTLPYVHVPNAIVADDYAPVPEARRSLRRQLGIAADERLILFAGSAFWPNVEALGALKRLIASHETQLTQAGVRFLVLGNVEAAPYQSRLIVATGPVSGDIKGYFSAADGAINPVTSGSGSNIKMVEYLAARLPILSTTFGARELDLTPGADFHCLAPDETKWIHAVTEFAAATPDQLAAQAAANLRRNLDHIDIKTVVASRLLPWLQERVRLHHKSPSNRDQP